MCVHMYRKHLNCRGIYSFSSTSSRLELRPACCSLSEEREAAAVNGRGQKFGSCSAGGSFRVTPQNMKAILPSKREVNGLTCMDYKGRHRLIGFAM